jgi:cysteine desulfuration protein SufE|tara:strand:+ start:2022 stop:2441 length:420 start_codon:yes stop_codon:yes gene_type:complete
VNPEDFVDRFNGLLSWEDRYRYLIQLGRKLDPYPEQFRDEEHLVSGCMSQVWLVSQIESGQERLEFRADSDALIVKGLTALLLMFYSNKTPDEILSTNVEELFERLNLTQHLSVNRRNGFYSMSRKIKELATEALISEV